MKKKYEERYETPEIEITKFSVETRIMDDGPADIVQTSQTDPDEDLDELFKLLSQD